MTAPHRAVAATRVAVRAGLRDSDRTVLAAVSGGADSLALAAALAFECDPARPAGLPVVAGAVVVDHGLQEDSAWVARQAAERCRRLGLSAEVVRVSVAPDGAGGPEARARHARYAALEEARRRAGADAVLLGHTRDDQAEQVLLGLARGSGTRSLAGMPPERDGFRRPFLALDRATTRAACAVQGLDVWDDPHNADEAYLRVRVRNLLAEVDREMPGVSAALARSASLLRDDADALDALAARACAHLTGPDLPLDALDEVLASPVALRRRVWRLLVTRAGVPGGAVRATHLADIDGLTADWRGQGPVDLPGGVRARRAGDPPRLVVEARRPGPAAGPVAPTDRVAGTHGDEVG